MLVHIRGCEPVQVRLVRAVAKGVRRTRSKFGARLEPFAYIDICLYPGRNLDTITQVQSIDALADVIAADYGRYTTACAVLETAERLAGEGRAPAPDLHRLTVGALRALASQTRENQLILDAYLVCVHCRPAGAALPSPGVLDLMEAMFRGQWEVTGDATESLRRQASGLIAAHLQWHLERQLRTLPLIERGDPHRVAMCTSDRPTRIHLGRVRPRFHPSSCRSTWHW